MHTQVDLASDSTARLAMLAGSDGVDTIPQLHVNGKVKRKEGERAEARCDLDLPLAHTSPIHFLARRRLQHLPGNGGLWRTGRCLEAERMMGAESLPFPAGDALAFTRAALASSTPSGRTVAAWLDPAAPPTAWADARTAAWEQLHTGPWREVAGVWRDAYGAACVLGGRQLLLEEQGGDDEQPEGRAPPSALAALDLADRALMMGGLAFHPAAHALAAVAEARLKAASDAAIAALPPAWPTPLPPPLPPGSLAGPPGARIPGPPALPSLSDFAEAYLPSSLRPHGAPVLLAGLASAWPARAAWATPAGLASAVGPHRTVPVELGAHYLADEWGQQLQRFGRFVAAGMVREGEAGGGGSADHPAPVSYLAQHDLLSQVPALRASILTPDYCALPASGSSSRDGGAGGAGGAEEGPAAAPPTVNVWFGPAGTVSPPHTDPHANLLVQVVGAKYVRLYAPGDGDAGLAPPPAAGAGAGAPPGLRSAADALLTNTSRVDLASLHPSPGAPSPAGLPFWDALIHPGEAVFIPRGWWHYVQALEPSASISFWWD